MTNYNSNPNPGRLTYDDFLRRVSIQDVLEDAGYRFYRRDGLKYPSYIRLGSDGRKVPGDKFIVNAGGWGCFHPPEQKVYNVISFIKEHQNLFSDYKPGMDKDLLVNLVCNRLLNNPVSEKDLRAIIPNRNVKPFRLSDYRLQHLEPSDRNSQRTFDRFFGSRGIDHDTQAIFKDFFMLATKQRKDGLSFANLSFPLRVPGQDAVVGMEERGRERKDGKSYRGKAEGSNGTEGLWIANLTGEPLDKAKTVLWFESAYDAMARFQLDQCKDFKPYGVYASTGGNPTIMQIRGMLSATPRAEHFLGFDKDVAGKQFVANFKSIADDMGVEKERVRLHQPLGYYKDWNDALLGKKTMDLPDVSTDYDYHVETVPIEEETEGNGMLAGESVAKRLADAISKEWKTVTGGDSELIEPRELPKGMHR
jgi:hypothetical protein